MPAMERSASTSTVIDIAVGFIAFEPESTGRGASDAKAEQRTRLGPPAVRMGVQDRWGEDLGARTREARLHLHPPDSSPGLTSTKAPGESLNQAERRVSWSRGDKTRMFNRVARATADTNLAPWTFNSALLILYDIYMYMRKGLKQYFGRE